jgi:hypothetical protein
MTSYKCKNCPDEPIFADLDQLKEHWRNTHTSPMQITVKDPWGERPSKVVSLYEAIEDGSGKPSTG